MQGQEKVTGSSGGEEPRAPEPPSGSATPAASPLVLPASEQAPSAPALSLGADLAVPEYGPAERAWMLEVARKSIVGLANGSQGELAEPTSAALLCRRACFVTLFKAKALRGCIGSVTPLHPLYRAVWEHARAAASRDPRFAPVAANEVQELRIEISVLSEPQPVTFATPEELLSKLRPGLSGVLLQIDGRIATFLPQVWAHIPDPIRFLDRLAEKAGYSPDAWKWSNAKVSVYGSESFEEPATGI